MFKNIVKLTIIALIVAAAPSRTAAVEAVSETEAESPDVEAFYLLPEPGEWSLYDAGSAETRFIHPFYRSDDEYRYVHPFYTTEDIFEIIFCGESDGEGE